MVGTCQYRVHHSFTVRLKYDFCSVDKGQDRTHVINALHLSERSRYGCANDGNPLDDAPLVSEDVQVVVVDADEFLEGGEEVVAIGGVSEWVCAIELLNYSSGGFDDV